MPLTSTNQKVKRIKHVDGLSHHSIFIHSVYFDMFLTFIFLFESKAIQFANFLFGILFFIHQKDFQMVANIIEFFICGIQAQSMIRKRVAVQLVQSYFKQQIPTILITTDHNKYIFNVPSSFQRYTRENRIKLPTMPYIFFTKSTTATITGLTGFLLTLYEYGSSCHTKLYLDDKLFNYMNQLRYKMGLKIVPISYCSWSGKLRKGINNFQKIVKITQNDNFVNIINNLDNYINTNIPEDQQNNALNFYDINQQTFQNDQITITPFAIESNGEKITNFIIKPNPLPGKILNDKLAAFEIRGTAISNLIKNGKIVIKGRQILLQEVKEPDIVSPNVLILHYNSLSSIEEIKNNPIFHNYIQNPKNFTFYVIHIVECSEIITSPKFKFILSLFADHVEHLVYNRQYRNSTDNLGSLLNLSAQVQLVSNLSKYFPTCMPNLQAKHFNYIKDYVGKTQAIDTLFPDKKIKAYKKGHEMIVSPKALWGYQITIDKKQRYKIIQVPQPFRQEPKLDEIIRKKTKVIDPKIVFLGTGSMKPSKYRNVSAIMVEFGKQKMLLDCGQGSHIQIAEHYGYQHYEQVLLDIRTIYITHIHSDHNLGILDLISRRNAVVFRKGLDPAKNKLFLVIPANVVPWFQSFCKTIEDLKACCDVVFIQSLRNQPYNIEGSMLKENSSNRKCQAKSIFDEAEQIEETEDGDLQLNFMQPEWDAVLSFYAATQVQNSNNFKAYLSNIGIVQFLPSPVIHCPQSYGIIIRHISDIKISYSGDTRPCSSFIDDAKNSTILIHEATFRDDLAENAESHLHSTVGEAIEIGIRSNSWKTALTHFSQRYKSAREILEPNNYKLNKPKQQYAENHCIVCFDHLEFKVSQGHIMPYLSRGVANAMPKDNRD